ncbi:protein MULTIPOLAR SPINDLE 1 isoform X1 [Dendrobium catenatum]|uniref:protein MULTIPOLAR SPINDLE 1 isoform X1 n=1 Tax=Dendrobium catenatum TaxID=906689 RepID=UPI00109F7AB2|nr:protein MULTIPOLAR SPINDLE 1 isoform X1 [Dendrobium catenatum]
MTDQNSLKIAIAIALFRLKNLHPQSSFSSESDAMRWKKKAKERKLEILKLREEVRLLEDGRGSEVLPEIASCRCHFFDECGDLKMSRGNESGGHWINEVLRRRFIRLVRWKGRKKNVDNGLVRRRFFSEFDEENEIERLCTSIDFLVEFADGISLKVNYILNRFILLASTFPRTLCFNYILDLTHAGRSDSYFSAIFHQAVDFILASLKNLLSSRKDTELLEDIVNGLILRLARRMCTNIECDETSVGNSDVQFLVQHLLRKLGTIAFVGQHAMLLISRNISATAERMLFMDPFDDAFPSLHCSIFLIRMQLMEFLVSDNFQSWTYEEDFDCRLFEEWVRSILQTQKGLQLVESRNGLYTLYMERLIGGGLVKIVGPLVSAGRLDSQLLSHLLSNTDGRTDAN